MSEFFLQFIDIDDMRLGNGRHIDVLLGHLESSVVQDEGIGLVLHSCVGFGNALRIRTKTSTICGLDGWEKVVLFEWLIQQTLKDTVEQSRASVRLGNLEEVEGCAAIVVPCIDVAASIGITADCVNIGSKILGGF